MKCNIGKTDRWVRFIAGAVMLLAGFYYQSWWGLIGVVPILSGAIRWCPLYVPLKISTCGKDPS